MGLSIYKIKKWIKMIFGKSLLHVNQDVGKSFSVLEIKGYYNNLTEKVEKDYANISKVEYIPKFVSESGKEVEFPISILQYALGCYDLYLQSKDSLYLRKFFSCVDWTFKHQTEVGSFDSFSFLYPDAPHSAMCQGEAASVLLRAWVQSSDERYLLAAKKSIDFMLNSKEEGGTSLYENEGICLLEYTNLPCVMNGWIFALFGLFDLSLAIPCEQYKKAFLKSVKLLKEYLPRFDNGYWSMYDVGGKIASPFYHNLHIAQMQALYAITREEIFNEYANRFISYQKSFWKRTRAFVKKAIQKILE